MKVLDIDDIVIVGKNKKYLPDFKLTEEYKEFQKEIYYRCKKVKIEKPYGVLIHFNMYHDIDAPVQAILDVLQKKEIITDDRYIIDLHVRKEFGTKGKLGRIRIWVYTEIEGKDYQVQGNLFE